MKSCVLYGPQQVSTSVAAFSVHKFVLTFINKKQNKNKVINFFYIRRFLKWIQFSTKPSAFSFKRQKIPILTLWHPAARQKHILSNKSKTVVSSMAQYGTLPRQTILNVAWSRYALNLHYTSACYFNVLNCHCASPTCQLNSFVIETP